MNVDLMRERFVAFIYQRQVLMRLHQRLNDELWFHKAREDQLSAVDAAREFVVRKMSRHNSNIAVGSFHSVGIQDEGILMWGELYKEFYSLGGLEGNPLPEVSPKFVRGDFVAVAAGGRHTLALERSGHVRCWGDNTYGQAPPAGISGDFVAIAACGIQSIALTRSGHLHILGVCYPPCVLTLESPVFQGVFVAISAGEMHGMALRRGGTIVCWGRNEELQAPSTPIQGDFVAIAAGGRHSLALRENGRVMCWGKNDCGQAPSDGVDDTFISIAAGGRQSMGLKANGTIRFWGILNFTTDVPESDSEHYVAIAAGEWTFSGLTRTGRVISWGRSGEVEEAIPPMNQRAVNQPFLTKVDLL